MGRLLETTEPYIKVVKDISFSQCPLSDLNLGRTFVSFTVFRLKHFNFFFLDGEIFKLSEDKNFYRYALPQVEVLTFCDYGSLGKISTVRGPVKVINVLNFQ